MTIFDHQIAVLTGASSGIGQAIASGLARQKMSLCLIGRDVERLDRVKKALLRDSPRVIICRADLASESDVANIATTVLEAFGGIDILVHCAGYLFSGAMEAQTPDRLDLHIKVNFKAPFLLTRSLLPSIKDRQGQIVFINSSAVQRPIANLAPYSSSKYALKGLADCLREEINPHGVRVISVYPGQTATPMQKQLYHDIGKKYTPERLLQPQDVADTVIHALTLSKRAEITDIFIRPMMAGQG